MWFRAGTVLTCGLWVLMVVQMGWSPHLGAESGGRTIVNGEDYFPDTQGSRWWYRGVVVEGTLQKIASSEFSNESTVKGTQTIEGVTVKVYHDTNPGNHGPSDSYYRKDAAGIVYYGSDPGTELERAIVPYQIVRFPLQVPSSFEQFDRKNLNFGSDLDGDHQNERADVSATVTVAGQETVTVPAGTYPDAVRIEARMTMKITLTNLDRTVVGTDVMTAWFAKGVGLVKYVERQEIPPLRTDKGFVSEITEELEKVEISAQAASVRRCESLAKRVFADHLGDHELGQIFMPAGLGADARQTMAPEGLATDERSGNRPVDVQVAHVKPLPRCENVPRTP